MRFKEKLETTFGVPFVPNNMGYYEEVAGEVLMSERRLTPDGNPYFVVAIFSEEGDEDGPYCLVDFWWKPTYGGGSLFGVSTPRINGFGVPAEVRHSSSLPNFDELERFWKQLPAELDQEDQRFKARRSKASR